ncbi:hemerythrin domain-containing protein [Vogesella facilis]|uniref:Hemerythrin domain-containing protein n=1 Tax=Vogesella facilis TaxID=1655232 RepID=A0ABV7RBE8_9NEIS
MLKLDALSAAAPSFDAPLEMLNACHDKVRHFCQQLDALPAYIAAHGNSAALGNSIAGIVRYFEVAGPAHHQDEEDELFPLILARQPDAAPKIEQLLGEHGYLHARWNAIRDDLNAYAAGTLATLNAGEIHEFTRLYREHAAREEAWLFPTASALISEAELHAAGQRMAARRTAPR